MIRIAGFSGRCNYTEREIKTSVSSQVKSLTACLETHPFPDSYLSSRECCVIKLQTCQTTFEKPSATNFWSEPYRIVSGQSELANSPSLNQSGVHIQPCFACFLIVGHRNVTPASPVNSVNNRLGQEATSSSNKPRIELGTTNHPNLHPLSPGVIVNERSWSLWVHPQWYCDGIYSI